MRHMHGATIIPQAERQPQDNTMRDTCELRTEQVPLRIVSSFGPNLPIVEIHT